MLRMSKVAAKHFRNFAKSRRLSVLKVVTKCRECFVLVGSYF
jgi:hypothetical protein